jgi:hypothetical protein
MQTHRYKTWGEAAGLPQISARLDSLPEGVLFPEDFAEPIQYDPQRKRLLYRGFMCSSSYAFLRSISSNTAYTAAVDDLFQASASVLDTPGAAKRLWPWLVSVSCLGAGGALAWIFLLR